MTKRTILLRSTVASLISGVFLAPAVYAGVEIRENQDFSEHMVPATEAVAPGAKAQKPAAPAPAQKMRITASGVVPESASDSTVTATPAPSGTKTAKSVASEATVAAKPEPVAPAIRNRVAGSRADSQAAKPVSAITPAPKQIVKAAPAVRKTAAAPELAKNDPNQTSTKTLTGNVAADKSTAQVKQDTVATAPVTIEAAAPDESSKPQLADGLSMRITANGIIPESEYELQLPEPDTNLAERDAVTTDAADDDIAKKTRKALSGTHKPYMVKGIRYKPMSLDESSEFSQVGIASWYGPGFHGRKTANGEVYNQNAMTAAHKRLPISSYVRVTRVSTGKSIVVRINDRGPFVGNRVIDLSYGAAKRLGIVSRGSDKVKIEPISKEAAAGERNTETQVKAKKML